MNLREFVSTTLTEIIQGVRDAQPEAARLGADVNPKMAMASYKIQTVTFDVQLSTQEASGTRGGVGVFVGAVGIGTQARTGTEDRSAGRVTFTVPVILPPQEGSS